MSEITQNLRPHFFREAQGTIVTPNCLVCGLPKDATIPDPINPLMDRIPLHTMAPQAHEMTITELVQGMAPMLTQFFVIVAQSIIQHHQEIGRIIKHLELENLETPKTKETS